MNSSCLVVAPYVGEFGWELLNWQGRVRRILRNGHHGHVVVCAAADRRPLYLDNTPSNRVTFCAMSNIDIPGEPNEDHRIDQEGRPIPAAHIHATLRRAATTALSEVSIDVRNADWLMPPCDGSIIPTTRQHQDFVSLRRNRPLTIDVLLVPRIRTIGVERNQTPQWWQDLAIRLESFGLVTQFYVGPIDNAIEQLSSSRLAIGASTGGLHLASLCGCPHYVWGSGDDVRWTALGMTNRQRYETIWNPLGTPCRYDECGWSPGIDHVISNTRRALEEIGLTTQRSACAWALKPRWRIKRGLSRLLQPAASGLLPWRAGELVRRHLV